MSPAATANLFTADRFEGALRDCDEGALEWVDTDRLTELPIWEGDKVFLRLLSEKEPFFSLKLVYEEERLIHAVLNGKAI